jgi:hypothetical protein
MGSLLLGCRVLKISDNLYSIYKTKHIMDDKKKYSSIQILDNEHLKILAKNESSNSRLRS